MCNVLFTNWTETEHQWNRRLWTIVDIYKQISVTSNFIFVAFINLLHYKFLLYVVAFCIRLIMNRTTWNMTYAQPKVCLLLVFKFIFTYKVMDMYGRTYINIHSQVWMRSDEITQSVNQLTEIFLTDISLFLYGTSDIHNNFRNAFGKYHFLCIFYLCLYCIFLLLVMWCSDFPAWWAITISNPLKIVDTVSDFDQLWTAWNWKISGYSFYIFFELLNSSTSSLSSLDIINVGLLCSRFS